MKQYFLDSCAIAKLYNYEVGSHRVTEMFEGGINGHNVIFYSELAYTETVCVLTRLKNDKTIDKQLFEAALKKFRSDFINSREENILPVDISKIIPNSLDYILTAHKLKNEVDNTLPYIQSLDTIQLGSWIYCLENQMTPSFVTADKKLARIANAYKDHLGIEVEVINLNSCGCQECEQIKADRSA